MELLLLDYDFAMPPVSAFVAAGGTNMPEDGLLDCHGPCVQELIMITIGECLLQLDLLIAKL